MNNCIEWAGAVRAKDGYGITWKDGKVAYAHRVAIGAKKGEVVMHTCDNRRCVNPDHLRLGSNKENSADMVTKGRQCKGEDSPVSKLTEEQVQQVRSLYGFFPSRAVGRMFGIRHSSVLSIWKNKTWRHVSANQSV